LGVLQLLFGQKQHWPGMFSVFFAVVKAGS